MSCAWVEPTTQQRNNATTQQRNNATTQQRNNATTLRDIVMAPHRVHYNVLTVFCLAKRRRKCALTLQDDRVGRKFPRWLLGDGIVKVRVTPAPSSTSKTLNADVIKPQDRHQPLSLSIYLSIYLLLSVSLPSLSTSFIPHDLYARLTHFLTETRTRDREPERKT